ncbi:CAP domain-containing protein [Actinophytocola sp.]|uniref:CAP domain-containing protein n=1 Tax=Actinophytocola sp. TaxID=1872138 RepID=UPI002ED85DFC
MLPALAAALVGVVTAGAATLMAHATESSGGQGRIGLAVENPRGPKGSAGLNHPDNPVGTGSATDSSGSKTAESGNADTSPKTDDAPAPSSSQTASPPSTSSPLPPATSVPPNPEQQVQQVVDIANAYRAEAGCEPLRVDARLTQAAQDHSSDMSVRDYFDHTTPEGVTFAERIVTANYPTPGAENIARGQQNAAQVMDSWMNSDGHRANILNCQLSALGVGLDLDGMYWTQDFGY